MLGVLGLDRSTRAGTTAVRDLSPVVDALVTLALRQRQEPRRAGFRHG